MARLQRLAIVGIVIAGGVTACSVGESERPPIEQTEAYSESPPEPVVSAAVPSEARDAERNRRAQRPADSKRKHPGLSYDAILTGANSNGKVPQPKPAGPRPPTSCRSVEPAPQDTDHFSGPHRLHQLAVVMFESASGFGFSRLAVEENGRGIRVPSRVIDRFELVSLLTDYEPSVYVLDEMATPALARKASRRPLDEFERRGLDAVRRGENLVWTREAPTRMFGAIRAKALCLECHANAKVGDLLGAFTYYLDTPVDQLSAKRAGD